MKNYVINCCLLLIVSLSVSSRLYSQLLTIYPPQDRPVLTEKTKKGDPVIVGRVIGKYNTEKRTVFIKYRKPIGDKEEIVFLGVDEKEKLEGISITYDGDNAKEILICVNCSASTAKCDCIELGLEDKSKYPKQFSKAHELLTEVKKENPNQETLKKIMEYFDNELEKVYKAAEQE